MPAIVAVADGLELSATLHRIITAAVDLSDATYGALGVVDEDGNLRDFLHVGMTTETVAAIGDSPKGIGVLGLLIDQPMPRLINDIAAHPASAGFPPGHPQMHSFLGIPLRVRGQVFGNLYLTEKRNGEPFSDADEQLVVALAAAAAVAIDNARLFEETRLRGRWHEALRVVDELDATIREIRNTIFALHESMELSSSSLRGLVLGEISQSSGALSFTPSIRFTGPVDSVTTQSLTDNVLAVLREALSNAARHAAATEIEVLLATADGKLSLVVTDNGIGFSDTDRRSGLANAASRSTSLGGVCRVERVSDAGGTVLHWSVPL